MVFKAVLLLLTLAVSQIVATSILQLRSLDSLEILEARQGARCTVCSTVSNIAGNCTTVGCVCNTDVATLVQDCVNCALAGDQSPSTLNSTQYLIQVYTEACTSIPGVPTVTWPAGVPLPSSTTTTGLSSALPRSTSSRLPVTVTTPGAPTPVVQSTVDSVPSPTDAGGGGLPPIVPSGAEKGKQAGYAVIGALLGAALLL